MVNCPKHSPMSVAITLEDDIDIVEDMIVRENNSPTPEQNIDLMLCWLSNTSLKLGGKYTVKHTSKKQVHNQKYPL